jgi:hypothetical protein
MTRKAKTFDCVEMKNRIQAERLAEYDARKEEFSSYVDFINGRIQHSELADMIHRKMRATAPPEDSERDD